MQSLQCKCVWNFLIPLLGSRSYFQRPELHNDTQENQFGRRNIVMGTWKIFTSHATSSRWNSVSLWRPSSFRKIVNLWCQVSFVSVASPKHFSHNPNYTRAAYQHNWKYRNKQREKYMRKHQVEFCLFVLWTTFYCIKSLSLVVTGKKQMT